MFWTKITASLTVGLAYSVLFKIFIAQASSFGLTKLLMPTLHSSIPCTPWNQAPELLGLRARVLECNLKRIVTSATATRRRSTGSCARWSERSELRNWPELAGMGRNAAGKRCAISAVQVLKHALTKQWDNSGEINIPLVMAVLCRTFAGKLSKILLNIMKLYLGLTTAGSAGWKYVVRYFQKYYLQ